LLYASPVSAKPQPLFPDVIEFEPEARPPTPAPPPILPQEKAGGAEIIEEAEPEELALEGKNAKAKRDFDLLPQKPKENDPTERNRQMMLKGLWWLAAVSIFVLVIWAGKSILSGKLDSILGSPAKNDQPRK
jgi:hypothetical protein